MICPLPRLPVCFPPSPPSHHQYSHKKCQHNHHPSSSSGISEVLISKLQRVHNYAARLIVRCDRRDHITPVLKKFHWLPVKQRVTYNIILLTFRALNGLAPIYIVDMLHRHRPTRALRSADNNDLQVPTTSSRYGDRAFAASAPRLWNALPRELKIATSLIYCKRLLKTYLFRIAYEQ